MKKYCIGFVMLFLAALIFSGCNGNSGSASIVSPDSATSIGSSAFSDCNSLTSVETENSVTTISESSFEDCNDLTAEDGKPAGGFLWENNFSEITITGYQGASNDITIPEKINGKPVTKIAEKAFSGFSALNSVKIPDSVKTIGFGAFQYCNNLTKITIPFLGNGDIGYINELCYMFGDKSGWYVPESLKTVVLTGGEIIDDYAFYNCDYLTNIVIPSSVKTISEKAFIGCSNLTSITYNGTIDQWNQIFKLSDWNENPENCTVHCTDGDIRK